MATFRDVIDRLALDYLNRTDLIPECKRAVKNAIKTYEAQRFWFNETATTTTTTVNSSSLGVPSDLVSIDRMEITYSGQTFPLALRSFEEVRNMLATSATGVPTFYAYYGDRFSLFSVPDSAYPVTCYYVQTLPALSADSDSNAWTNEAQNLIIHQAAIDVMGAGIVDATNVRIERHAMLKQQAWNELQSRNDIRKLRRLRATKF